MSEPLTSDLRKQLESAIKEARRVAEPGVRRALEALAVGRREPHASMLPEERALRNRLRAHGRQLGDERDRERGTQQIEGLVREVAYEHWHRMLFARFLAENQLLIEPESGVSISMAECEELARAQGEDAWAFAGRAASRMLPRIFRPDDPALEVALAPETRQALERLLESLPVDVFTADDSLGWTYQFWQAERKDAVNASGVKIGADELPAVTQLFTEHYMVLFLFHNTIGAWRAGKLLAERPDLAREAASEDELRRAVRLGAHGGVDGYDFSYLRFVREPQDGDAEDEPTGPWRPAAGRFESWPRRAADLRVLDPCCGSGHFLVEGFELLVRLRMEEEGLALEDAIRGVLEQNLFGLELDARCTQIAAFNLALAAWKLAEKPIELPPLQIACSGLALGATKKEWIALAGEDERLRGGMTRLYELFAKAPELGSLIDPHALTQDQQDLLVAELSDLEPMLVAALEREGRDDAQVERAVAAHGMARAADLLAGTYTLVITNVPYLGRGNQTNTLKHFAEEHYKEAKADLATMFVSRAFRWLSAHGTQAVVTPQNWLFLTSYMKLREKLLSLRTWNVVARLGPKGFQTPMWDFNVMLSVLSAGKPDPDWQMTGLDVMEARTPESKAAALRGQRETSTSVAQQSAQLENPDCAVALTASSSQSQLSMYATINYGSKPGQTERVVRAHWEVASFRDRWQPMESTPSDTSPFDGKAKICMSLKWLTAQAIGEFGVRSADIWGERGIVVSQMSKMPFSIYLGRIFDNNTSVIHANRAGDLPAIYCYVESGAYVKNVRRINQKLDVAAHTMVSVAFDLAHWQKVAAEKYPDGLPEPQSDDPTQWLFHGHPAQAEPHTALQVAVARLLGYRWPPEHDAEMRLADEARAQVERCRELEDFADEDGIVCLSAIRGEASAADRMRKLLAAAFGSDWSGAKERELLSAAAGGGKAATSLEEWLRDRFFEEHAKLFHHRPFVWHLWDGRKDGFHALVNYHRLAGPDGEGRRTLEALTYSYLGDWTLRQKAEQREGREGADARLAAAQDLQAQLECILEGAPPCDLFVRWKPLRRQALGWDPDIDDGVRLNIRPFMRAALRSGGRKGGGLLRWKPNVKWKKDRGKEPQSIRPRENFPWFWSCPGDGSDIDRSDFAGGPEFDGNRWNDLHYTHATKRDARARAGSEEGT